MTGKKPQSWCWTTSWTDYWKGVEKAANCFRECVSCPRTTPIIQVDHITSISNDQPSRLHRGRGFARARQAAPVAVQPTQAPEAALPPPPPVFTPEPTGELVTGVECPEPEGLQVFQIENSTTTKSLAGLPKPRLLPPVLQVRQWHSHPWDLWQWPSFQWGSGAVFHGHDNIWYCP